VGLGGGVTDLEQIMPTMRGGGGGIATATPAAMSGAGLGPGGLPQRSIHDRINHDGSGPGVFKIVFLTMLLAAAVGGGFYVWSVGPAAIWEQITSGGGGGDEASEGKLMALKAWQDTETAVMKLATKVQLISASTGKTPDIEDLIAANVSEDLLIDGYGMYLRVDTFGKLIMSNGPDGRRGTTDDFIWDWERGRMTQKPSKPAEDATLEEDLYETRRPGQR
jgi:hypothetical protein